MNIIEWAFGKRMTPQEKLRKHQRALEKTMRELDREKKKLEGQQNTLQRSIKQNAEKGQLNAAKVQAKDLARTRKYIERFNQTSVQLKAISLRIQTVRTNEQMMQSMKGATRIIGGMNRTMNLPALSKIAQDFERENDIMEQRQEMMEDAVDDALGDPAEEEESEETINQILDELGVEFNSKLGETPSGIQSNAAPEGRVAQAIGGGADDDLEARLASLRK
ncbi:ESCRT-III subunit protein did4 [Exophiala xenobiotica]|uniref:ESCRT-III subunit protein did4 n=1 Tax=Lithohypha guttulata TaxID=1690604 RepID=A0ABR0JZC4_9EURO|nr:ESCRT-III subunit protein did4 [Lithohypha guttulata]KAK5311214.1 ESCRT-III subunit protein did4 [Exophiala xenobiotica]